MGLEDLIFKSIDEVEEYIKSLTNPYFKIAIIHYKHKNCGQRYPSDKLKLADIDFNNLITFDELFSVKNFLIIWCNQNDIITDFQTFTADLDLLKNDYLIIKDKIDSGNSEFLREGDTSFLGAARSADGRYFCLKKKYLEILLKDMEKEVNSFLSY